MQQKFKAAAVVGACTVVLIGAGSYIAHNNIDKREKEIAFTLAQIQSKLPPGVVQDNQVNKGLFSSNGVYRLSKNADSVVLKYQVNHGLTTWFGADIKFHSTLHIESPDVRDVKVNDQVGTGAQWAVMDGTVSSNGDFSLQSTGSKIESEAYRLTVEPSRFTMNYNKKTDDLASSLNYPKITLGVREKKVTLTSIAANSTLKINNPNIGHLAFSMDEISDKTSLTAKNIKMEGKSDIVNDKIDMTFSFKVGDIVIQELRQKDTSFELAYSVKGLDQIAMAAYKEIQMASAQDLNEVAQQAVVNSVKEKYKQMVATGVVLSVDQFKVLSPKGLIELSASAKIKPVPSIKDISLEKNTELKLNLVVDGEFAQMASLFVPPEALGLSTMDDQKRMTVALQYSNNALTVNSQPSNAAYGAQITEMLKSFDDTFKEPKRETRNLKKK